jgi:hypothetical protein
MEAEFMYAARNRVQLVALYAQPEFAYTIVNPLWVGTSVAQNQAAPHRLFQIASGQGHCGNAPVRRLPRNCDIAGALRQQRHEMHSRFGGML